MIAAVADHVEGSRAEVALEFHGIEKRFGESHALKGVSLLVHAGTVHALVGENGAGKSTMLGIATGRVAPTRGQVTVFGERLRPNRPRHARHLGVAAIYQELTTVPALSALENVFLGAQPARRGFVNKRLALARYEELSERVGIAVPPEVAAGSLSVSEQQMLEIMRAMTLDARVVLFDEPTSALPEQQREAFFRVVDDLRREGCAIVLVSHNLDEVAAHADQVSVFRDGEVVAQKPARQWTKAALVSAMIGADKAGSLGEYFLDSAPKRDSDLRPAPGPRPDVVMTAVIDLPGRLNSVELTVRKGEIVGIAGLVGSGRSSLLRTLAGLEPHASGSLVVGTTQVRIPRNPREALRLGLDLIPEDRKNDGLCLNLRAADNIVLSDLSLVARRGMISDRKLLRRAAEIAQEIAFAPIRVPEMTRWLSGGNQQKLLIGRWRHAPPRVLLADEPTRGVDIGAKAEILLTLREFAAQGGAVLFVSSELEEVLATSDRTLVLRNGHLVAELDPGPQYTVKAVLQAAFHADDE